jgi:hypothetical protein
MTIEQMFKDAGFTPEYIKSREIYLKGYDSITDKVKHLESVSLSKREVLSNTVSEYFKDDSLPKFDWD